MQDMAMIDCVGHGINTTLMHCNSKAAVLCVWQGCSEEGVCLCALGLQPGCSCLGLDSFHTLLLLQLADAQPTQPHAYTVQSREHC